MTKDEIVAAVAEKEPLIPSEIYGDLSCYWCHADENEPHEKDCVWLNAKELLTPHRT